MVKATSFRGHVDFGCPDLGIDKFRDSNGKIQMQQEYEQETEARVIIPYLVMRSQVTPQVVERGILIASFEVCYKFTIYVSGEE